MLLVSAYKEKKEDFRNPKVKKRGLWTEIKNVFLERGYIVTEDDLDRKWRNMKKTYTGLVDNKSATGRGRIYWEFYEDFQDIYSSDKSVNMTQTISSLKSGPQTPTILQECNIPVSSTSSNCDQANSKSSRNPNISSVCQSPNFSSILNSPSVQQKEKTSKRMRNNNLYYLRKQMTDIEERRVEELSLLRKEIEKNNIIQQERNDIFKKLLEK